MNDFDDLENSSKEQLIEKVESLREEIDILREEKSKAKKHIHSKHLIHYIKIINLTDLCQQIVKFDKHIGTYY